MTVANPTTLAVAVALLLYSGAQAIRTRRRQYFAWSLANVMLATYAITGLMICRAAFIGGIAVTIGLQWRDRYANRPISVEQFLRQAQDESIRRAKRAGKS